MSFQSIVYRVLISSPSDVDEERQAVQDVIYNWNSFHSYRSKVMLDPVLWERNATPDMSDTPQDIINKQLVDNCDFMIAFFGTRIGTDTGKSISGTVEEIELFIKKDKPVLLYFSLQTVDPEHIDPEQLQKLREYRKKCERKGLIKRYKSVAEFREMLSSHLTSVVDSKLTDHKIERLHLQEAIERNPFLNEIVTRINKFEKLSERCIEKNSSLKKVMAKCFWKHCFLELVDKGVRSLFFESGSTIAYLSTEFRKKLNSREGREYRDKFYLTTNNILTYLQFILFENIDIYLVPSGPPENTYGATFGKIAQLVQDDPPNDSNAIITLRKNAKGIILSMSPSLVPFEQPSLLLGTASGLELRQDFPFPGPHVGSYHNKIFKRAMLKSPHPLMFFLDYTKISPISEDGEFIYNKCYPVCDNKEMWEYIYKQFPLAFCIGADTEKIINDIIELFDCLGFEPFKPISEEEGYWIVVLRNQEFFDKIGKRVDLRWSTYI